MIANVLPDPLAYLTAKSQGWTEEAQSILDACGLTEDQVPLPSDQDKIQVPRPIVPTFKSNWPFKEAAHSSFEKALLGEVAAQEAEAEAEEEEEEEEAEEEAEEFEDTAENGVENEEEEEQEEEVDAHESHSEDEYTF